MRIEEMRAAGERAMLDYCQTDVAAETIVRLRYDKIALIKEIERLRRRARLLAVLCVVVAVVAAISALVK